MLIFHFDFNFMNPRVDYLHAWIDRLADMGYTALLWELEDKVQWETCPECVHPDAMTKEEFRGLLAHARERGMDNMPLLQTIGHAEYVLKHEPYVAWRENPARHDCYCTSKPEVRAFLKRWIGEYIALFGELTQFHLGGDEAYEFGKCPICRAQADATSRNALYADHITDLAEPIRAAGIKPGIWCDMVLHHPEEMDAIPTDFVIWDWNYWDGHEPQERGRVWGLGVKSADEIPAETLAAFPQLLTADRRINPFYTSEYLRAQGREVIVCSATRSAGDALTCGRHETHAPNVVGAAQKVARADLQGTLVTSWGIRLHCLESQWPWIALAAEAYRQPQASYSALLEQVATALFGDGSLPVYEMMTILGTTVPFARRHESGVQYNGLKDPVLCPVDYLTDWLTEERVCALQAELETTIPRLTAGTRLLADLRSTAERGGAILDAWAVAAERQSGSAFLARLVLAEAHASNPARRASARLMLSQQHAAFYQNLAGWLSPRSARETADIAYSGLSGYLGLRDQ